MRPNAKFAVIHRRYPDWILEWIYSWSAARAILPLGFIAVIIVSRHPGASSSSGMIEFLVIGTAVKQMPGVKTASEQLIPQAIIRDQDTFINTADATSIVTLNQPTNNPSGIFGLAAGVIGFMLWLVYRLVVMFAH